MTMCDDNDNDAVRVCACVSVILGDDHGDNASDGGKLEPTVGQPQCARACSC